MTQIKQIIQTVLEENDGCSLDNDEEREAVAAQCAARLTEATIKEVANLLGGFVATGLDGCAAIYTDFRVSEAHQKTDTSHIGA